MGLTHVDDLRMFYTIKLFLQNLASRPLSLFPRLPCFRDKWWRIRVLQLVPLAADVIM